MISYFGHHHFVCIELPAFPFTQSPFVFLHKLLRLPTRIREGFIKYKKPIIVFINAWEWMCFTLKWHVSGSLAKAFLSGPG